MYAQINTDLNPCLQSWTQYLQHIVLNRLLGSTGQAGLSGSNSRCLNNEAA